jgi:hypothetical protein
VERAARRAVLARARRRCGKRYTMELLPAMRDSRMPKLLVWGEDDEFQTVDYAERFPREMPETRLVRIKSPAIFRWKTFPKAWRARWPASSGRSDDLSKQDVMKVAILDDYQNVAQELADWSGVRRRHGEITVFNDHVADPSAVVERLQPFDVVCVMRERTPLTKRDPATASEPQVNSFDRTAKRLH